MAFIDGKKALNRTRVLIPFLIRVSQNNDLQFFSPLSSKFVRNCPKSRWPQPYHLRSRLNSWHDYRVRLICLQNEEKKNYSHVSWLHTSLSIIRPLAQSFILEKQLETSSFCIVHHLHRSTIAQFWMINITSLRISHSLVSCQIGMLFCRLA